MDNDVAEDLIKAVETLAEAVSETNNSLTDISRTLEGIESSLDKISDAVNVDEGSEEERSKKFSEGLALGIRESLKGIPMGPPNDASSQAARDYYESFGKFLEQLKQGNMSLDEFKKNVKKEGVTDAKDGKVGEVPKCE